MLEAVLLRVVVAIGSKVAAIISRAFHAVKGN
jgi:hypothetical protein